MLKKHIKESRITKPLERLEVKTERANEKSFSEIKKALDKEMPWDASLNMFGLPKDLPGLANVSKENLNETIGTLTRNSGLINMNDPIMQGIGILGLAYAVKPGMVKSFLGTGIGGGLTSGLCGYSIGKIAGGLLSKSAVLGTGIGGASGWALGTALAGPIGGVFGFTGGMIGSIFGGHKRRNERRQMEEARQRMVAARKDAIAKLEDAKRSQGVNFDAFMDHANNAIEGLMKGKEFLALQQQRLQEQRDLNIGIIAKNTQELTRVAGVKNEAIQMQLKKTLSEQRVQMSVRGTSSAGSDWFVLGETEDMGLKAQQELRFEYNTALDKEQIKYQELMKDYGDLSKQLEYSDYKISAEARGLETNIKTTRTQFDINMRQIDRDIRSIDRGVELKSDEFYTRMKNLDKTEALTAIAFGEAIKSTKEGINPFDSLINYNVFKG